MSHGTEAQFPPSGLISFQVRSSEKFGSDETPENEKGLVSFITGSVL